MRKKPHKDFGALHVFLGLLVGFFLGSTIVYWNFNRQNDRMLSELIDKVLDVFPYEEQKTKEKTDIDIYEVPSEQYLVEEPKSKPQAIVPSEINKLQKSETINNKLSEPKINTLAEDTVVNLVFDINNTMHIAEEESLDIALTDNYNIARDKLIYSKTIIIPNFRDKQTTPRRKLDSLIGKTEEFSKSQTFFIEFWKSPLNSIGYKMSKNKIMFYGLQYFESVSISSKNGKLYLNYLGEVYYLEFTNSFKPLVPLLKPISVDDLESYQVF